MSPDVQESPISRIVVGCDGASNRHRATAGWRSWGWSEESAMASTLTLSCPKVEQAQSDGDFLVGLKGLKEKTVNCP